MKINIGWMKIKVLLVVLLLAACADDTAIRLGPQQWEDLEFVVETRPSPIRVGMNEFIVIASREVYKPGVGLVVTLRVDDKQEWRQAIQDGFTGVYRRALRIDDPKVQTLSVHVRRTKDGKDGVDETELYFPFSQAKLIREPAS
ncbi:MAG: hypothetical protein GXP17_03305 [Gammaproteobacteria bacterium]|nr:hypothetical protein [Gammaproteobacteria bacterium]